MKTLYQLRCEAVNNFTKLYMAYGYSKTDATTYAWDSMRSKASLVNEEKKLIISGKKRLT